MLFLGLLIIINLLFVAVIGFSITLGIMGKNPRGKASAIFVALIAVGLYFYAITNPHNVKLFELTAEFLFYAPVIKLYILGVTLVLLWLGKRE